MLQSPEFGRRAVLLAALPGGSPSVQARPADEWVQSVGVCTHLGSQPYAGRLPMVQARLRQLGIRTIRDELRDTEDHTPWQALYRTEGIKTHWLASPTTGTVAGMLAAIAAMGPASVAAIEGQNEGDSDWFKAQPAARPTWDLAVIQHQRALYQALRQRFPTIPIVSPTLLDYRPEDVARLRPAAPFCDIVGLHPYAQHGQEPETADAYAGLDWYVRRFRNPFKPGAPAMATEAGYSTAAGGISERAAAIYLPRLLLHFYAAGLQRTFLYELLDEGTGPDPEQHYGLLYLDGTPKPAFTALAALMTACGDPGPAFTPGRLALGIEPGIRSVLLKTRDGRFLLALWRPERCWDPVGQHDLPVLARPTTISLSQRVRSVRILGDGALPTGPLIQLDIGAEVRLIEIILT